MNPDAVDESTPEVGPHAEAIATLRSHIGVLTDARETDLREQLKQFMAIERLTRSIHEYGAEIAALNATISALNATAQ